MIVYSAIVPNSPFFIPELGKENHKKCKKTLSAYKKIAKELEDLEIESIVIINKHEGLKEDSFSINLNTKYSSDFSQFGDFSNQQFFYPDHEIINALRFLENGSSHVELITEEDFPYPFSVPLMLLSENKKFKISPLSYSGTSGEEHFEFGKEIGKKLHESTQRIAILLSINFSFEKEDNEEAQKKAKDQDELLIQSIKKHNFNEILDSQQENPQILRPLSLYMGILKDHKKSFKKLSYERPFSIGFLTAQHRISE